MDMQKREEGSSSRLKLNQEHVLTLVCVWIETKTKSRQHTVSLQINMCPAFVLNTRVCVCRKQLYSLNSTPTAH